MQSRTRELLRDAAEGAARYQAEAGAADAYLQLEQARKDVLAVIEKFHAGTNQPHERWIVTTGVIGDASSPWLQAFCMGAMDEKTSSRLPGEPVIIYPTRAAVAAYFQRARSGFFIVSDLGAGWKAFRLRTGRDDADGESYRSAAWEITDALSVTYYDGGEVALDDRDACITQAELPDVICRVILASLRIANLATPALPEGSR